jgi:methylenetetrahydrofolate dehydrogenase (NADP+) / methenyltetrahydrofolate cyclohydrolase
MAKIIDGKALAEKINDQTVQEVLKLPRRPFLAIILVGENPDSELYVNKKIFTGKKVGIDTHLYKCADDIGQSKLIEMIEFLNSDEGTDAIMVQLPLPRDKGYDTDAVVKAIKPGKDVDRFHPDNIGPLTAACDLGAVMPPVFGVILEMLKSIDCDPAGKRAAIISKSEIFGGSLAKILACRGADAEAVSPDSFDLPEICRRADILIPVIGRPKFVKKEMIKEGAVIIDVGITREMGSTFGDVDFEDCFEKAGYISPVPGGVGPMTVAITLRNTLELNKRKTV